jgi:hypothetical protein
LSEAQNIRFKTAKTPSTPMSERDGFGGIMLFRLVKNLPKIFSIVHCLWLIFVTGLIWVVYTGQGNKEELRLFVLAAIPDYPAYLFFTAFDALFNLWKDINIHISALAADVFYPTIFLLVFGTLQWWLIGISLRLLLMKIIKKDKSATQPE